MRWNRRLDMPPPKTFESTSRPYLRRSEYVTVSVAKTTWVCAVSFSNDRRTLRTAGGTGGTGGGSSGASDVDGPSNQPWASTSLSSSSCVRFPAAAITQLPGKYARSCKCLRSSAESALTVSLGVDFLEQLVVRQIPRRGDHAVTGEIRALVQVLEIVRRERADRLLGAKDLKAVRVAGPERLICEIEDFVVRRVGDGADFLEHHLAFERQIGRAHV